MLPLDILEAIISNLAREALVGDLHACALTSRAFVAPCQSWLYRDIVLAQGGYWDERTKTLPPHPIKRFHGHLSKHPHLGRYVRNLEIVYRENHDADTSFAVLDLLDRVRTFTFGFYGNNMDNAKPRSWLHRTSDDIRIPVTSFLKRNPIQRIALFCVSDLPAALLQSCRQLRHLSLYNISGLSNNIDNREDTVTLESFEIEKGFVEFVEGMIFPEPMPVVDLSEVQKLVITSECNEEDAALQTIMGQPRSLKYLKINLRRNFTMWSGDGTTVSRLAPSSIQSLRVIKMALETYWPEGGGYVVGDFPLMGGLIPEFAAISGQNSVEEIDLELDICHQYSVPLDTGKCDEFDTILSKGFPRLRKLRISVAKLFREGEDPGQAAEDFEEEWTALFREHFTWCRANLDFVTEVEGDVS